MAKSVVYKRGGTNVEFNMTPMIDVTFQLIIFFIIAGQIASDALAKMELSDPETSVAIEPKDTDTKNKILINVVSRADVGEEKVHRFIAGQVSLYLVDGEEIELGPKETKISEPKWNRMVDLIEKKLGSRPEDEQDDFFVEIRSDRRVFYSGVEPVVQAAVEAGVNKMNITALLDTQE